MADENDNERARNFIFRSLDSELTPRLPRPVIIDDLQREFTAIRQEARRAAFSEMCALYEPIFAIKSTGDPQHPVQGAIDYDAKAAFDAALEAAAHESREGGGLK